MGTELDRLEIQIEAGAKEANTQLDNLVNKLDRLQKGLTSISGVANMNGLNAGIKGINTNFNMLNLSSNKLIKSSNNLTASFAKLYVGLSALKRGFSALKESVSGSMDFLETANYFEVAMRDIGSSAADQWEENGYNSAEAYAESFAERAKELTEKMTGYSIDENGNAAYLGVKSLGMDPDTVMQYQATFAQVSSSIGIAEESALKFSKALTMLGADWASLRNLTFEQGWEKFASALAGQSRAVRSLGIDITNATLQEYAYKYGLEQAVSEMNQATKAQLRLLAILDQSEVAFGDLANTISSPSNQLRMLQQNVSNLGRVFGNLFMPVLQKTLPVINGTVIALQNLFSWIGNLMGIEMDSINTSMGGMSDEMYDLVGGAEDCEDALDGANEAAKKLKNNLQSWHEINNITTQDDSNTGSGSSNVGGGSVLLDDAITGALADYEKAWNEAFEKMENKAQAFADKVEKFFQPIKDIINDFAIGDYFQAGQDTSNLVAGIFDFFSNALNDVDWYGIGENIGEFLEGIEWTQILDSVGDLIWEGIQGAVGLWKGSFDTAPIETIITTALVGMKIAGVTPSTPVTIALAAIVEAPNIAKAIGEALGIEETIFGDSIDELSWSYVFEKLQEGFTNDSGNLSFTKGVKFTLEVLEANVTGTAELLGLSDSENPLVKFMFSPTEDILRELPVAKWMNENIIQPIIQGGSTLEGGISNIWDNISSWWNNTALVKIKGIPGEVSDFISELPGKVGYWLGYSAGEFAEWTGEIKDYLSKKIPEIIGDVGNWFEELPQKIVKHLLKVISNLKEWGVDALSFVKIKVPEITDNIISFFEELPSKIFGIGEDIMSGLWNGLQNGWNWIKSGVEDFGNGIAEGFKDALDIHSPSRVMFALGEFTMEGFQLGMENLYAAVEKSVGGFSTNLQYEIAATPKFEYSRVDIPSSAFSTKEYNSYSYYGNNYGNDAAETNALLRQQNELLLAILEKPNLGDDDIFRSARRVYRAKASRLYGGSAGVPIWG